ncbi:DnaJ homolog subfamily B member 7 (mDj5) [Durusdinium trenchii]|uniref:DnaJ homolog subfamily B member 7 (MDj5) n=1 Tax=Durusdinium trenchii TaxID=1381693 RepID=A0ABP0KSY9_9DINO
MPRQPDYYEVLGVPRTAGADEIRRAYKQQALRHHPDKNPENVEEATAKFKLVSEAYSVLNDVARRAAYDSGKLDSSNEVEPTFTANMAHDLFREVFGDEFARRLAAAAGNASSAVAGTIDFVAESETFKAAKHATASGISKAAESVGQSQVVRSAVAKHLGSLADQANSRLAERERSEALSRQALDIQRGRLEQHCKEVAEIQERRNSREMTWWAATWEWINGEQAAADRVEDRKASAETKKLQAQLLWAKTAWQKAASDLKEARLHAAEAEQRELQAMKSGVSLQDAADAGAYMFSSFLDRVRGTP